MSASKSSKSSAASPSASAAAAAPVNNNQSLHQLWDSFRQAFKQVKAAGTLLAVQDPLMELFNIVKAIRDLTATKQQQAHADKAKLKEKLNKLIEEKVILRKNQKPVAKGCRCGLVGNAAKICIDCVCVKLNRDCGEYCGCQHGKEDRCQRNNPAEVDDEQQEYELFFVSDNDEEMVFNDEEEQEPVEHITAEVSRLLSPPRSAAIAAGAHIAEQMADENEEDEDHVSINETSDSEEESIHQKQKNKQAKKDKKKDKQSTAKKATIKPTKKVQEEEDQEDDE